MTIAFLTGYFAFLPASVIGVSGVLAVVTAGVYIGWYTPELTTVETRLQGRGFWEVLTFLLNVLLFGLVGLQLRPILDALSGERWSILGEAAAIVLAVIVLRIVWVFTATYLPRRLIPRLRVARSGPPWTHTAFISWNGMRGAVTIAAALLIPLSTDAGTPLPGQRAHHLLRLCRRARDARRARTLAAGRDPCAPASRPTTAEAEAEEALARVRAAEAALARLDELEAKTGCSPTPPSAPAASTASGSSRFTARADPDGDGKLEKRSLKYQRLRRELLEVERQAVVELRNTGEISDAVMRKVERDLDLEVSRLDA